MQSDSLGPTGKTAEALPVLSVPWKLQLIGVKLRDYIDSILQFQLQFFKAMVIEKSGFTYATFANIAKNYKCINFPEVT